MRAVQTAEIVAMVTRLGERDGSVEVRRDIAPGGNALRLVLQLASDEARRVMLVGHEPDLSALVAALVGALRSGVRQGHGRGGCRCLRRGAIPRLRFVLDPKALTLEPKDA